MSYVLSCEWIGQDTDRVLRNLPGWLSAGEKHKSWRPWVAEIIELKGRDFERRFLDGEIDYSHANSVGSRGVLLHFDLEEDCIYEVRTPVSWKTDERYFCYVRGESLERVPRSDVVAWLSGSDPTPASS